MSSADSQAQAGIPRSKLPRHVAIIMDGNGRWARKRLMPRIAGHRAGVEAVRNTVRACARKGIEVLTLFAFSSENWRRPQEEVSLLMELLLTALQREVARLHENDVCLRFIGERSAFAAKLAAKMTEAEQLTRANQGLKLVIAVNYGGRWDITQATRALAREVAAGALAPEAIDEKLLQSRLALADLPEPDLFIRTGGEQRVSNFLLWQLAYTELYFTDTLWPDFDDRAFDAALESFAGRQRRFGRTGEQVEQMQGA
ncbi:MAG TPA: isoprenyl transferase [Gammaproteobacteria bacterium]|nr:isoprenyl transferase [Gammaproteobacteria bacterium]